MRRRIAEWLSWYWPFVAFFVIVGAVLAVGWYWPFVAFFVIVGAVLAVGIWWASQGGNGAN